MTECSALEGTNVDDALCKVMQLAVGRVLRGELVRAGSPTQRSGSPQQGTADLNSEGSDGGQRQKKQQCC